MVRPVAITSFICLHQALAFSTVQGPLPQMAVVGKIIIDEYRPPEQKVAQVSIGGGGPQAAFGAAAAYALISEQSCSLPVTFVGAVGEDWTSQDMDTLQSMLPEIQIKLFRGENLMTPRIWLWHDEEQNIVWRPLNDSFGPKGADNLWRNRPSAHDMMQLFPSLNSSITCHAVLECGSAAAGGGEDASFLRDSSFRERIKCLGIEPVTFPDESTGMVSKADASCCVGRLATLRPDVVSPDKSLSLAIGSGSFTRTTLIAERDGPRGSLLRGKCDDISIPAATLATPDGKPVNPTGAGNAYSGALTACLGAGVLLTDAAAIASAVGAVLVEYEHMPPWNDQVLARIREAAAEVTAKAAVRTIP